MGLLLVVAFGALGHSGRAQSVGARKFETASLAPAQPRPALQREPRVTDGRLEWYSVPLRQLVGYAYNASPGRIEGALPAALYDIAGTFIKGSTVENIKQMTRSLLEDRLSLRTHKETRQMAVLKLGVEPGGPRLKAARVPSALVIQGRSLPPRPVREYRFSDGAHLAGAGVTVGEIAEAIETVLRRPVLDQTAISGAFDVDVVYQRKTGAEALSPLRSALRTGIGLKLDEGTSTVTVLIIDRIGS
ncbi:MAG TPA: TIGR03435 family protein [Vicinamibacterales bacterium]|nr:TIGR03435 family protein [Vicinamibacterales bacterium]